MKEKTWLLMALGSLLLLSGCLSFNPGFAFTPSKQGIVSDSPADCKVRFVSLPPSSEEAEEIGTIRQTSGGAPVGGYTMETMREVVPAVCKAGGNIVWTELSGRGFLVRGVVFRERSK